MTRFAFTAFATVSAPTAITTALALLLPAPHARAQDGPRWVPPVGVPASPAPRALNAGAYASNTAAARVVVEVARDGLPADGQSATAVTVRVFAANGQPLAGDATITVEASGGRVLLPGARTDELGPNRGDADRAVKGTQIPLSGGVTRFNLIAPDRPQEVVLRVTAGAAQAEGAVTFLPDLRDTLAVGLVEGVIRLSRKDPNTIQPVRLDDGFEAEIRRFQRQFSNGRGDAAVRAAFFLKGKIKGDALLTAAFDSDKETRGRLLRDIKPESFYPVYGDSSVKTFDAQSSSKLYVRVDKHKSYLLYGDFATGDGFSQPTSGGMVAPQQLRSLGAYNRTLTGARGHWEQGRGVLNVFAAYDTLKQVVEELRAFGTSGPFVLRNNSALENSEKVEIVIRRKDSPGTIKSVTPLRRFDDYNFEPFSGRILLARPLPSIDSDGDLASLRVTYEVDQGGERFWVGGADAQVNITPGITLGGSVVQDKNALAPYKLGSVNVGAQLNATTRATAEVARSSGTLWDNGGAQSTNPTFAAGEQRLDQAGNAARVAVQHQGESTWLDASWIKTARDFFNPAAPLQQGRSEANVKGGFTLRKVWRFFVELLASKDVASGGRRVGGVVGAELKVSDDLTVTGGVRRVEENAAWNSSGNLITPNPSATGGTGTGGLYGGIDPQVVNPSTGQASTRYALLPAAGASQGIGIDATTVFLGARYKVNERLTLHALAEGSVQGDSKHRYLVGGTYQLSERSRLYANYEDQSGITSAYGAARSRALSIGAETNYMPGGDLFTEYRLRDATSREAQWANGVRNTWLLKEGVTATTGAEYVSVLNGQGGSAAAATVGLDYTANPLWKLGARLEWRRVFDNNRTPENDRSDSLLSTLTVARKLDRDWTLLVRNYLLANRYASSPLATGNNGLPPVALNGAGYNALQNRFQVGMAYRPVDTNALDVLAKYENKLGRNADGQIGLRENVHVASLHGVYHPARPWWLTGRLAAKSRREDGLSADGPTRYDAWMASGRLVYDITESWDLGLMAASLQGRANGSGSWARQYALGLEAGYQLQSNLWLSAGYNVRGFSDKDLTASEYTNRGVYLRLRFKFDEDLFRGNNRSVNRTLDRDAAAGAKP
jgi:hypothetical protein